MTTPANQAQSPYSGGIAPPTNLDGAAWALFLDFDGTLVDIAMTPDAVVVTSKLRKTLSACVEAFDGAVAIVSGRPIATLDALLGPSRLPAAGLHGLELRMPDGTIEEVAHRTTGLAELRARFHSLVREDARLVVEDKGSSLSLHFRRAPERERELRELAAGAAMRHNGHHVMHGKMVLEVRPTHADKGTAVARFLETHPFAGRTPVFAGDDVTDEDGFAAVNRLGGISVKVGEGESAAACRVPDVAALPTHDVLIRALFSYDVVGFQTEGDRDCFFDYVVHEAGGRVLGHDRVQAYGREIVVEAFPIGIDAGVFTRFATTKEAGEHAARMRRVLNDRQAILGVDRLDYSKGLPERFRAFERLLADYPENRGRVSYIQIAPRSRDDVQDYIDIRHELESLSGSINSEYSEFDWTPLRYINRSFTRRALAGLFRIARIGLVTPLRDGMNLVAKEYVAAQSPRDPGVLVLSRFAGAARQADGAIIVNPYDVQGVADALQRALNMSLAERKERWRTLVEGVRRDDVTAWRESFLERLYAVR